ncbi:MAG: HAD-IB family phosphatase [Planctomycetales bacterium]|nr:HAD-IB family phosphatase [Planctomycetales bacterium]
MISVIIPVLNESETIGSVVAFARRCPLVTEVIVVDDGSLDDTPRLAIEAGARVITSTLLGKGASMEDGLWAAQNEIVAYLDGDLSGLRDDLLEELTLPIREGRADFVKAGFSRRAGRVTTLTARPLLKTFFPELNAFEQPLGGIIAARRSLLRNLRFETDYGVDLGLFLDASAAGAELAQVDIGHIEHDSHPLEVLGDMAQQVVRTLLDRASRYGRLTMSHVREVTEIERQSQAEFSVVLNRIGQGQRLALFDMDGTLLRGRFVVNLAQRTNKTIELSRYLDNFDLSSEDRTRGIAALFAGVPQSVFEETARAMPLMPGAAETVIALRKAGYRVGIVTDSFRIASEIVRRRVFADFSIAHLMQFQRGEGTGQITLSPAMTHPQGCPQHSLCKLNVMQHVLDQMGLHAADVLAVGDGENDICLLKAAAVSVAVHPQSFRVRDAATHVIDQSLTELLNLPGVLDHQSATNESLTTARVA